MTSNIAARIDPVAEPSAYQQMLLEALGDDDPADVQRGTPAELRWLVADAGPRLRTRPADGEWSALEVIGHIADAEVVYTARYRWILAHDEPPLIGYEQDDWVRRLRHNDDDPEELLRLVEGLRDANLALWERTPVEERARVGMHAERGPESFDLSFRLVAGHDRVHVAQARQTLEAVADLA